MSMTWTLALATCRTYNAGDACEARRQVMAHFQDSVEAGDASWRINDLGQTELHLCSGEVFLLGETGVTRLR